MLDSGKESVWEEQGRVLSIDAYLLPKEYSGQEVMKYLGEAISVANFANSVRADTFT